MAILGLSCQVRLMPIELDFNLLAGKVAMRVLKIAECAQVAGAHQKNLYDGLQVATIYSATFGWGVGGLIGLVLHIAYGDATVVLPIIAQAVQVTLPVAVLGGVVVGGTISFAMGGMFYLSGVVRMKDQIPAS